VLFCTDFAAARGQNLWPDVLAAWYLHNVEQCARLAGAATDAHDVARFASERCEWLGFLAEEIGADVGLLEAAIALLPMEDGNTD
jgi:hypothetical protein